MDKPGILFISLFIFIINTFAAKIDTIYVQSKSMHKSIPNIIILPDSYTNQKEGYSVLYLLHGAGNDCGEWLRHVPELTNYVDNYNFIIVCPDGGGTSWYFDSPIDSTIKYETYISKELVGWIDSHYRTIPDRSKRAIAGLSMGGHGAFYLAFKQHNVWGAAGSLSGGLDIRPFPNNWDLSKRLGSYAENKDNWEKNTVINLLYLLDGKSLKIIFDCGVDDFFYDANLRVHKKMLERNIPHDFIVRPGSHEWNYWVNAIKYQLLFFNDFLDNQ